MAISDNEHNLLLGHCNIQGGLTGLSKTTQLNQLIKNHNLDILSLNETNLDDTIVTDSLNIPIGYHFIRNDRGIGSRGGCGMIISNNCAYSPVKIKSKLTNIEAVWIKLTNSNIYICGFYRSTGFWKLDNYLDYFIECMKKLQDKKVIWIGDVNIDQNKINNSDYKKFDSTLKSFNMIQTIQNYTRIAKKVTNLHSLQ